MKTGVIDVGGGFRGIYAAGVFDYCMDQEISFDLGIGISAGSANLCSYAAGQKGRNYCFYTEYGFRKQYMSLGNFIKKGSYVDMDYIYGTLSNSGGENPLDYAAFQNNRMEFYVVAANALTGQAQFFDKTDICQDCYDILKASSSIPFACKPYQINGIPYYDGALGDPVPIEKAFELGCDRVVLILTKPEHVLRTPKQDVRLSAGIRKRYPLAAEKLCERAGRYNESVAKAQEYAKQGRALIIAPDDTCGINTLRRDKNALEKLYQKGYHDAQRISAFINDFRSE